MTTQAEQLARIEEQNRRIEEMVAANRQANKQIKARETKKAKEKGV